MANPSLIAFPASAYNSSSTSHTLNTSALTKIGDALILIVYLTPSSGVTTPSGWTHINDVTGLIAGNFAAFLKIAAVNGSETITISTASASLGCAAVATIRAADQGSTIANFSFDETSAAFTFVVPSITTHQDYESVLLVAACDDGSSTGWLSSPSLTQQAFAISAPGACQLVGFFDNQAAAGPSTVYQFTKFGLPAAGIAQGIFIRQAPIVITRPITFGMVGVPYSSSFSATGGQGGFTWAVIGGALPVGLSLNASTGALTGTPTVGATTLVEVTATDSVGQTKASKTVLTMTDTSGVIPANGPSALNMFQGQRLWLSRRDSLGQWRLDSDILDLGPVDRFAKFSGGAITPALAGQLGAVVSAITTDSVLYVGNGPPASPVTVTLSWATQLLTVADQQWDKAVGSFHYNGCEWMFLLARGITTSADYGGPYTYNKLVAMVSTDGGATWAEADPTNSPVLSLTDGVHTNGGAFKDLYWDGVSNLAYIFTVPPSAAFGVGRNAKIYSFDMSGPGTWTLLDSSWHFSGPVSAGPVPSSIVPFANGDIGIIYSYSANTGVLYNLLSGGVWSGESVLAPAPARYANKIFDPVTETTHLFLYDAGLIDGPASYITVDHAGTPSGTLYTFPALSGNSDGIGYGTLYSGLLLVPYDDQDEFANAIIEIPVASPSSAVKKFIPVDPTETGEIPSCAMVFYTNIGLATTLQLIKEVIGTDPASAWLLEALGPTTVSGNGPSVGPVAVTPGDYPLTETGPGGYRTSGFVCVGMTAPQVGQTVTIAPGDNVICTIRNTKTLKSPPPQYHHRRNMGAG